MGFFTSTLGNEPGRPFGFTYSALNDAVVGLMRSFLVFGSLLVVPLALLLFLQWPLREVLHAYSHQVNDVGQILFALYVAVAVPAASRAGTHLAASTYAHERSPASIRWQTWATLACVGPWAAFMLWVSYRPILLSMIGFERFAETLTPGFFVVKLSLGLLLILVLIHAVGNVAFGARRRS